MGRESVIHEQPPRAKWAIEERGSSRRVPRCHSREDSADGGYGWAPRWVPEVGEASAAENKEEPGVEGHQKKSVSLSAPLYVATLCILCVWYTKLRISL